MAATHTTISVLGLGGAGCRTLRTLGNTGGSGLLRLFAVDTDAAGLEASGVPAENRILAGAHWRGGRGCGGNIIDGQRALAHERQRLEALLRGSEFLLVVGGLGGGTASGGVSVLLSVARKLELPTMFLLTMPFTLEGHGRLKVAESTVKDELLGLADAVVCLPNDLLFSVLASTTPLSEAFELADRELARTVLALTAVLRCGNLLAADFGNFVTLLKRRKSFCSIGVGISTLVDPSARSNEVVEAVLHSPLLGGGDKLADADAVIWSLIGGPELSIGEMRTVLELAAKQGKKDAELIVGAATGPEWAGMIQLTALTVKFDAEKEIVEELQQSVAKTPKRGRGASASVSEGFEQPALPLLDTVSKGAMENTLPVIEGGEDLDVPTFKRRGTAIDDGKISRM